MATDASQTLIEALGRYEAGLPVDAQRDGKQELNRFVQWCGRDRGPAQLTPHEVAEYAASAGLWGADSETKLKPVRSFLAHLKKQGITQINLAPHLKVSKSSKSRTQVHFRSSGENTQLTAQGYANLKSRLEMLLGERIEVVGDIQRAMADKDFKENAPLDAAKERQGFIESGIRDLERILANAVVTTPAAGGDIRQAKLGRKVTLKEASSGKRVSYTLVDSREADPVSGKISSVSPVGKALLGKEVGDEVEITVPRGTLHYVIERIEA